MIILGVDPGQNGGYALMDDSARLLAAAHFPQRKVVKNGKTVSIIDGLALANTWRDSFVARAFVEQVAGRPRQAGQFQFGVSTGMLHGILCASDIPFALVAPATWKAMVGIKRGEDETKQDTKTRARIMASSLYPDHAHLFSRVKDDGPAEATLIALYGIMALAREAGKVNTSRW